MEMEISLLPVKPGTVSDDDKAVLRDAGVIVIEHEEPETLRLLRPAAEVDSSELLLCAMKAIGNGDYSSTSLQACFAREVSKAIRAKEKSKR